MVTKLNEAYSPELPRWLLNGIGLLGRSSKNRARGLVTLGIDPAHSAFITAPVPTSGRDAFFKDPNKIPVYRLLNKYGNEYVYIPGVNGDDMIGYNGDMWYLKDLSRKALLSMTTEFGYIVPDNSAKELRSQRSKNRPDNRRNNAQYQRDIYGKDENGYTDYQNPIGKEWVTQPGYDKSGYKLDPEKYVRKLNEIGLDNYADKLEKYYNMIVDAQKSVADALLNYDVKADLDDYYSTPLGKRARYLEDAITDYKSLTREVSAVIKRYDAGRIDESEANTLLKTWVGDYGSRIYRTIKNLK